jgi:peptidoglycan/xylan/chitin deacetylase (PgdA/CDA1 family)
MIGSEREFWWDEMERLFLGSHELPEDLTLRVRGRWHRWETRGQERAEKVLKEAHRLLMGLQPAEREQAIAAMFDWAGVDQNEIRGTYRALSHREVEALARHELIEIGSHGSTHTRLTVLSRSARRGEIEGSRRQLTDLTGRDVTSFSYPFGLERDTGREAYRAIKKFGYRCAVTGVQGCVRSDSDPLLLPRRIVRNWTAEELDRRLAGNWNV